MYNIVIQNFYTPFIKTLESPMESKEIRPIFNKINSEYSLEDLMLKLQYFGHLMWTADSLEKGEDKWISSPQTEKGMTEGEIVGWNHQFNEYEVG